MSLVKSAALALVALLISSAAQAQSNPDFTPGQTLTASQLNAAFQSKQDALSGTSCLLNSGCTWSQLQKFNAGLTASGGAFAGLQTAPAPATPPNIIVDDDCTNDPDCVFTWAALHHWMDMGAVNVLAFIGDSPNTASAPVYKVYENYYNHTGIPIGALQSQGNVQSGAYITSAWNAGLVAQFDPGDTNANYPSCVTQYRTTLAAQPNASVKIVETGFLSCIALLMQSPADGISPLTGAQLLQQKVSALYIMGGDYPTGAEFNMQADPIDSNYVFANWTSQNGYPPIYLNGVSNGGNIFAGRPAYFSQVDPAAYTAAHGGSNNRPMWDALSYYEAIFGQTNFTLSANGTNTVNASTGANSWSSGTASGHFYVTISQPTTFYEAILDGQVYTGANWFGPAQTTTQGTQTTPVSQCSAAWQGPTPACEISRLYLGPDAAPLTMVSAANASFNVMTYALNPSLTAGNCEEQDVGFSTATNNLVSIGFCYQSSGASTNYGYLGMFGQISPLRWYGNGMLQQFQHLTFSTLPTCNGSTVGSFTWITDASSVTYLAAAAGGGTTTAPVFCNGSAWIYH